MYEMEWQKKARISHEIERPIIKRETEEEAEEHIQKELSFLDIDVNNCDVSMMKRAISVQASLSYYLNEQLIDQQTYYEYHSQLEKITKDAIKNCICKKK